MKIYQLHKKQNLPISVNEAWEFLSSPENLKTITPDYMSFDILSGTNRPMYPGQIIQYIVTPILGIKTKWVPEQQELNYPLPIVDHKFARERCLKTYKEVLITF